jgi:hypothetical protein
MFAPLRIETTIKTLAKKEGESMKRFLFALSILVMTAALAACASDTSPEATATPADPAAPAASAGATAAPASTPAAAPAAAPASAAPKPAAKPNVVEQPKAVSTPMVRIPEGTTFTIVLTDPISTAKNKAGDTFTGSLAGPIVVNGETVVDKGATVRGRVVEAEGSGRVKGTASIVLTLTSIVAGEKAYPIATQPFAADAETSRKRDAGLIGGAAGVGAAIGALAGGKGGAAKGALIGGAAGTGAVLATKGREVEFDSESKLTFALQKDVSIPKTR